MKLRITGNIRVPGDKSITHRALMLATAAEGESRLRGLLSGADCRSTAEILRHLGCAVPALRSDGGEIRVMGYGFGAWRAPAVPLDCGNSGTTARLMMGLLAGRSFCATLTGDASLRRRPMRRISDPLAAMGARVSGADPDHLPLEVCGNALREYHHRSPKASAQIKSAVLLAGLSAGVRTSVWEPARSRDHTERMLQGMGVDLDESMADGGWQVELEPPAGDLAPLDLRVPGDPSSAAFLIALALLADGGEIRIEGVGTNPSRTGFFRAVGRMGGTIGVEDQRLEGGEPVGNLVIRAAELHAITVHPQEVPAMIDEIPIVAILAARAAGETRITGAEELRVKESDRITLLVDNLRRIGVEAEELPDGLVVAGSDQPLGGRVRTGGDHRIAMAFGVLGALPGNHIEIDEPDTVEISFPGFWDTLRQLAAPERRSGPATHDTMGRHSHGPERPDGIIIAIDGPAGSGKSTTAGTVAMRLGYRHLDSGALYRGLTLAALRSGIAPERWAELTADDLAALDVRLVPVGDSYSVRVGGADVSREIRSDTINAHVSRMAAVPAVRQWLLGALRETGKRGGVVVDGRDIGTVVFPDAELKVFLVCSLEERAIRRLREVGVEDPADSEIAEEMERLRRRDELDSTRAVAPLSRAPDAVDLDTTGLSLEEQVTAVEELARGRRA